jgi:hypothetical protein
MTPRPRNPGKSVSVPQGMVKTTLLLPEALWRRGKVRAMEERRDLRDLLIEGLEMVLREKRSK